MNVNLKVAIVESGRRQCQVAQKLAIPETRLSAFVHERLKPTESEKKRIAKLLNKTVDYLFPSSEVSA